MNRISVALCTYNGAQFLDAQLESLLAQTRLPDELVVGDDLSSDETLRILEDFARHAKFPVQISVNEENLGSTENFEQTIARCTGDLIFLADQDDVWLPEKIEKIEAEFAKNAGLGMVFSDAELVGENLQSLGIRLWDLSFPPDYQKLFKTSGMFKTLVKKNVVTGATIAFRAGLRRTFIPIPTGIPNIIHDAWIALVISAEAEVLPIEKPLIKYRQHARQQLGIGRDSRRKMNRAARRVAFQNSIEFFEKERARLLMMKTVLRENPQFKKAIAEFSVGEMIDSYLEENLELSNHYTARMDLSPALLKRIFPVWRELLSGRYRRFSKGLLSVGRDIFEG